MIFSTTMNQTLKQLWRKQQRQHSKLDNDERQKKAPAAAAVRSAGAFKNLMQENHAITCE